MAVRRGGARWDTNRDIGPQGVPLRAEGQLGKGGLWEEQGAVADRVEGVVHLTQWQPVQLELQLHPVAGMQTCERVK